MCDFCENIRTISNKNSANPLTSNKEFPIREELVLARIGEKIVFYGFNKYHYEDDAIYEDLEVSFCPKCGRKLVEE